MALDMDIADDYEAEVSVAVPAPAMSAPERLLAIIEMPNIAVELDDTALTEIATTVIEEYEIDDRSRHDWLERTQEAIDLAMLVAGAKDYPFTGAANVKYPLLTTAALQFNARAYPAIVQGDRVAKCRSTGKDPDGSKAARAERVSEHLSWQLTDEMPEWEEDTDRLTVILPIVGCVFRKIYYDPALGRKCSRLIRAEDFVANYNARSMGDLPRSTERMWLYPNEIIERIRDGRFLEFDYENAPADDGKDRTTDDSTSSSQEDASAPHLFLEQHRLLDLDGDGYPEPYIVTIHHGARKICRIVANFTQDTARFTADGQVAAIRKQDFYVRYVLLPSPDGGFYGLGLGHLLKSTNEAINTTLNEMLDAGHLTNIQGGFVSSALGIREKSFRFKMGEYKVINTSAPLNQAIMPVTFPGPSEVLFKLLGLLIEMGKDLAAIKDVLTGEQRPNQTATATLALIEQGLQVFTAIFKRIHRSLKAELKIHGRLNAENLDPGKYSEFFDTEEPQDPKADYADDMGIMPVSDPTVSSRMQKLAKAAFIGERAAAMPMLYNPIEAERRILEAADIEDLDTLLMQPPEPDPKEAAFMDAMRDMSLQEMMAKIGKLNTAQLLDIANAEAAEEGQQLSFYDQFLRYLETEHSMEMDNAAQAGPGGMGAMAGQPDNAMGAVPSGGQAPAPDGNQNAAAVPLGGTPELGVPAA